MFGGEIIFNKYLIHKNKNTKITLIWNYPVENEEKTN